MKKMSAALVCLCVFASVPTLALAREESVKAPEESVKEWPPRESGTSVPILFGTEAYGGGLGYVFWDMGGKPHRRLFLLPIFADTDYRTYLLEYTEPSMLAGGDQLDFTAFYQKRTGTHYFGIGPDVHIRDGAYYQRENYLYKLSYKLPLAAGFGVTGEIGYDRTVIRESTLKDRPDFNADYEELDRPIEDVYPEILRSREAGDEFNHYWAVSLWLDTREGPKDFTVRGVYLNGELCRVDENNGADWNYWHYTAEAALYVPVVDEHNVFAGYARWDRMDGENVPFYKLPGLGMGRYSLSHVLDQKGMRGIWENEYVDRNRFLSSVEYRHRVKGNWIPESWGEANMPFDFNLPRFIRNMAWHGWLDMGQVWPDDEHFEDVKYAYGIGAMMYFDNGIAQQISLGYSDELSTYMTFSYGTQF